MGGGPVGRRWLGATRFCLAAVLAGLAASVSAAQVNETQETSKPPPEVLDGFADIHVHEMANFGFGGAIIWGPAGGAPSGLGPIPRSMRRGHDALEGATHGRFMAVLFRTLINAYVGDWFKHGEEGYPSFASWPSVNLWTHQQVHKDLLFRAYQGGLRLMVMLAENSEDAFGRGENELPIVRYHVFQRTKAPGRSGNDMESLDWQIRGTYLLEAEIDAEYGGPGKGWYRIVRDPDEAADVISQGKLAVILGTELQHLFNCDTDRPACTPKTIVEGLNRLESMGVNYVFPLHHKVNQFGGPARFTDLNNGPAMKCPESKPSYTHDCSAVGLTELGKFLILELSARGMLIDVEHMSLKTFNDTMDVVEQRRYPVFAGHVVPFEVTARADRTERAKTRAQLQRIFDVGGIVAPMIGTSFDSSSSQRIPVTCRALDGGGVDQWANAYLFVKDIAGQQHADQLAFSTDWNGFAGWPRPRDKCAPSERKVSYPYPLPVRLRPAAIQPVTEMSLLQWPVGGRTWDFDHVGAANVGMVPDFLQDTQLLGLSPGDLEPIYRSARTIVNLWSRVRHNNAEWSLHHLRWAPQSSFETFSFPESFDPTRTVEALTGFPICRSRREHKLGFLETGECHLIEAPSEGKKEAVEIAAYHDGKCVAVESWRTKPLVQHTCGEATIPMQRWYFHDSASGRKIIANSLTGYCLSSPNHAGRPAAATACSPGNQNQQWLSERRGNTFLLIDNSGLCLEVKQQSRADGAKVDLNICTGASNQLWSIDALRQKDYETLYQADKQRYSWVSNPPDPLYPYAVGVEAGRQICRAKDTAWIGVIYGEECLGKTYDSEPFETPRYEGLFQAP
jgi:microsomal dipeptidase-like Zn-dependent dipeptidase